MSLGIRLVRRFGGSPRCRRCSVLRRLSFPTSWRVGFPDCTPKTKTTRLPPCGAHIERHVPYDHEYRLRTNQGDYQWFRARGQGIWDEQGNLVRMAGSLQCVTDRKCAEDALRRNEQLLNSIINNSRAVIYAKDVQRQISADQFKV